MEQQAIETMNILHDPVSAIARQKADAKRLAQFFKVAAKPKSKRITKADVDAAVTAVLDRVAKKIADKARHESVMIFKSGLTAALSIVQEEMK